jgi:hypothetical protein
VNGGNWTGYSRDTAGGETTVDLGVTVAAATLYKLRIEFDKSRTEARFFVDDAYTGRVTANMPASGGIVSLRSVIVKSAGTTARTMNTHKMEAFAIYP